MSAEREEFKDFVVGEYSLLRQSTYRVYAEFHGSLRDFFSAWHAQVRCLCRLKNTGLLDLQGDDFRCLPAVTGLVTVSPEEYKFLVCLGDGASGAFTWFGSGYMLCVSLRSF